MRNIWINVDFDGTCVTHEYPDIGKSIGAEAGKLRVPSSTEGGDLGMSSFVVELIITKRIALSLAAESEGVAIQQATEWGSDRGDKWGRESLLPDYNPEYWKVTANETEVEVYDVFQT